MAGTVTNDRLLPGGMGLRGFAPLLDPDWNCWMDENLLRLSALTNGSAISRIATPPPASPDGAVFIVPGDDADNPNQIAVRDAGAFVYFEPFPGLTFFVETDNQFVAWNGTEWAVVIDLSGGGGTEVSFLSLGDTPNTFENQMGRILVVNSAETGFVYRSVPYDVPIFTPGRPAPASVIRILISRNMVLADGFVGSMAMAGTPPAEDTVFLIRRSGVNIGTVTFAAGTPGGLFAADVPGQVIPFNAGQSLEIVNPAAQDESIQDLSYTFVGSQL